MVDPAESRPSWLHWVGAVLRIACLPLVIIWPAGDWGWAQGWALCAIWMGYAVLMGTWLWNNDRDLLAERLKGSPVQEGQKGWDKVLMVLMLVAGLALVVLPSLDHRWGWSSELPPRLQLGALLINIPAFLLVGWVMRTNTFLSRVVKLDEERDHRVITTGPYAIVRHPMYLAVLTCVFAMPLALGSWWGLLPAAVMNGLLVARAVLEDRMLHEELLGYREYAQVTRYRLLPGIF